MTYLVTGALVKENNIKFIHQLIDADSAITAANSLEISGWQWLDDSCDTWSMTPDMMAKITAAERGRPKQLSLFGTL